MLSKIILATPATAAKRSKSTVSHRKKLLKSTSIIGAANLNPMKQGPVQSFFMENAYTACINHSLVVDVQKAPLTENFTQGMELEKHYLVRSGANFLKKILSPWHDVKPFDVD
jgi:hypothetical protein